MSEDKANKKFQDIEDTNIQSTESAISASNFNVSDLDSCTYLFDVGLFLLMVMDALPDTHPGGLDVPLALIQKELENEKGVLDLPPVIRHKKGSTDPIVPPSLPPVIKQAAQANSIAISLPCQFHTAQ